MTVDIEVIDDVYHPMRIDMRYPAHQKQETRERIVRAASRHFRGRGGEGVAIADLMGKLNLTHGGFYKHFDSKEQLFAEAVAKSFEDVRAGFAEAVVKAQPGDELRVLIEQYLSLEHCANPDSGCPLAALASEIPRYPRALRVKIDQPSAIISKRCPDFCRERRKKNVNAIACAAFRNERSAYLGPDGGGQRDASEYFGGGQGVLYQGLLSATVS